MGILTGKQPTKIKDRHGRIWRLEFDEAAIERISIQTSFPLTNASGNRKAILDGFGRDPAQLIEVLYASCQPQAEARDVTPEEFASLFVRYQFCKAGVAISKALAAVQMQ